ncbi:hypothetical protein KIPB_002418 [Kipferlia bialata]|uniref:Uncharacterized protein n=1 Tax=Kipferlia bialata TaxID=797122 RepID=A0A9K3CS62_9EUKA|nr:hypothetical protein KIPB_002418 [Kipferlia bialata]|eukprot:g2418.t1
MMRVTSVICVVGSVVTCASFLWDIRYAYTYPEPDQFSGDHFNTVAELYLYVSTGLTALLCIILVAMLQFKRRGQRRIGKMTGVEGSPVAQPKRVDKLSVLPIVLCAQVCVIAITIVASYLSSLWTYRLLTSLSNVVEFASVCIIVYPAQQRRPKSKKRPI